MTQSDTTGARAGGAREVRYRGRHLPMVAVVVAASIATALAYSGMVLFGLEVAGMSPAEAYALAGFLEVSLVAVALMARNAALEGRPYGVLLSLTWLLSGTSGVFAALHEVAVPDASTPYMVAFRFVPPLVAALMWHLALVGERHLVTGHTLEQRRREHRVHQYVTALELWRDARLDSAGTGRDLRKVRAAHRRQRIARDGALKLLTVEDFEQRMQVWVERLEAAERHGNRLDSIGASSVKRGVSRSSAAPADLAAPAAAATAFSAAPAPAPQLRDLVAGEMRPAPGADDAPAAEPAPARFAEAFEAALADDPAERAEAAYSEADHTDATYTGAERSGEATPSVDAAPTWDVRAPGEAVLAYEPLPETGHTRRVEVFDLIGRTDTAAPVATATDASEESESGVELSGEDEPMSDRDRRIVELADAGLTRRAIADQVSASATTVGRVLRRYRETAADEGLELARA